MKNKSIQVLGSGCPTCKQLFKTTRKIVKDLKIETEVEYITDVTKIIEMGVMTSPALVINGDVVLSGGGISEEEIQNVLKDNFLK